MFEMTLDTAVAATTAKVRKPVTEKTLSCLSTQTGAGVTTETETIRLLLGKEVSGLTFIFLLLSLAAADELRKVQVDQNRESQQCQPFHV